jgi:MFS transporter, MHS family, citrate/tricarballylate:H+ symporter
LRTAWDNAVFLLVDGHRPASLPDRRRGALLVILFRMLQGFALGGKVGPTTAFMVEAAPPERRGFYASFQTWTQSVSILASGLVGFGLASALGERQLQDFGWRIAFLIGAGDVPAPRIGKI